MLTLNVGPSKIAPEVRKDIEIISQNSVLEYSHRSTEFTGISKKAIEGLRDFFSIPKDYKVFFTSSATDAIQLSVTNCCQNESFHFLNGNFAKLPLKVAQAFGKRSSFDEVRWGEQNDYKNTVIPQSVDYISIEHNETSSGVVCSMDDIATVKNTNPQAVVAVDITSSAGATKFNISAADIWSFSVQKCFGLPAGLGVTIVSPAAYEKSIRLSGENKNMAGLFTYQNMWKKMEEKFHTIPTPNVFGIYLLAQQLERWNRDGGLNQKIRETQEKVELIKSFVESQSTFSYLAKSEGFLSETVFVLCADEEVVKKVHELADDKNMIIGKGYRPMKKEAIRIANFPSVTVEDIQDCIEILKQVV